MCPDVCLSSWATLYRTKSNSATRLAIPHTLYKSVPAPHTYCIFINFLTRMKPEENKDSDGYYGGEDVESGELDLSFLDDEDKKEDQ